MALGFREQYCDLLKKLGNPHKHLPPTIHVAGTNGKGSTIAFLNAMLEASGQSVHTYTSPHLIMFNERIVLNGMSISDEHLETLIDETLIANNGADVTFFEITTAMAFKAFADTHADVLLLETGLGGRLDCTNIISHAEACIITPVSLDHTEFLGDTLGDIAREKAGILKPDTPCIVAAQHAEVKAVMQGVSCDINARLMMNGKDWSISHDRDGFDLHFQGEAYRYTLPALKGGHQI